MDGKRLDALDKGRSHVIARPRLTRVLDEATSRILLLLAPAGYGKTMLAREWLEGRRFGWYRGTQSTADVAALAVGLARAAAEVVPGAGERMINRLRTAPGTPKRDVEPLAELLAEDLVEWPADAWLVFDDYQFACDSDLSEMFVELVASLCPVQLLVTSRTRPSWATAKRLLYGEVFEVGRNVLAMSQDEAEAVLAKVRTSDAREIVALADGWPALIGLAALADDVEIPEEAVPEAMYAYFAEELYRTAAPDVQKGLRRLSLASSVTPEVADALLGADTDAVLTDGLRLGFLSTAALGRFDLHPLVRSFLEAKFSEDRDDTTTEMVSRLARALLKRREWDDVFSLIEKYPSAELLVELFEAALPELLGDARLPTLARWVEAAAEQGTDSPVIDLAEAEIAFRNGEQARAEALALQASRRFEPLHRFASHAFHLAGLSAHLRYRDETALEHFGRAGVLASNEEDEREAIWGQFLAVLFLEEDDASPILRELAAKSDQSVDSVLRLANGRMLLGHLYGDAPAALYEAQELLPLISRSRNPLVRSSFLHSFANSSLLSGNYDAAIEATGAEIKQAVKDRLKFILPHARSLRAAAFWGIRAFTQAIVLAGQVERAALRSGDGFLTMNVGALRARLELARGAPEAALVALDQYGHVRSTKGMYGEYLAWWSLVEACVGETREAQKLARKALSTSRRIEVSGLVPWTTAVLSRKSSRPAYRRSVLKAFRMSQKMGNLDACVAAYRACPDLLEVLAADERTRGPLKQLLARARDEALGAQFGISPRQDREDALTPREREVLALVAQGLKNKEIAGMLYISEATAKVHVRKICQKLGVRTRTEAALRATEVLG